MMKKLFFVLFVTTTLVTAQQSKSPDLQTVKQLRETLASLTRRPNNDYNFSEEQIPLIDITCATILLAEEIKKAKTTDATNSLEEVVAFNIVGAGRAGYNDKSDSDTHGLQDLYGQLSLMLNRGILNNPNTASINIEPSIKYPEYFELQINTDGISDRVSKDKQPAHTQFATVLKTIDSEQQNYSYYVHPTILEEIDELEEQLMKKPSDIETQNRLEQLKQKSCIMGEITGSKCNAYGCDKNIIIYCRYETMKYLIQSINSSKYRKNKTVKD